MISARVELDAYSNKVLNMVKVKFDLHDKSEALNRFVHMFGDEIIEREVSDEYVKKIIDIDEKHLKKYGKRKMSIKELDELCGVD